MTKATSTTIDGMGNYDSNNHYGTSYSYDARGNIMTLNRQGQLPDNSFGQIDSLDYDYYGTSNQLKTIADLTTGTGLEKGFKPDFLSMLTAVHQQTTNGCFSTTVASTKARVDI